MTMSKKDVELERWRSEWQALGGREGLAEELARRAVHDGRRIRRAVAGEIAGGAVAAALSVWLLVRTRGDVVVVSACAGILVFLGVCWTRLLTLRQGSLGTAVEGLDGFVKLSRRRVTDDLGWNRFSLRATKVLAALLAPWCVWAFVARYESYRMEPWRAVVGFGGVVVILAGLWLTQRRKQRKLEAERDRFESLVADRTLE